ncbi:hypothetical protein [Eleftheria terrae]|uniref:hypothetical protein n=1 Tax=Eleftheria terrae TaxID=1597781 RepID=UPI00263BCF4E|nr:hypothetical protein [Eleftheria terrae]WKB52449.1 hypothetical protein N7L95_22060 [Eleftheria terrae]
MSTKSHIQAQQTATDVIPRMLHSAGEPGPVADWMQLFDACSRSAVDAAERTSAAWVEAQAMIWLTPLQWWYPNAPLAPRPDDSVDEDSNKLMAGTVPPQPFQEAARELWTLGWRGMGDWQQWWAPWYAWAGQGGEQRLH